LEELGGWKEDTLCLGFPSVSPNVYFKAKACKVFEDKIHAFGEAVLCIEGKSAVIHVEALKYFIRAEERGVEHFRSMVTELAISNLVISSSHDSDNFDVFTIPFQFERLRKCSNKKKKQDWCHVIPLLHSNFLQDLPHLLLNLEYHNIVCIKFFLPQQQMWGGLHISQGGERGVHGKLCRMLSLSPQIQHRTPDCDCALHSGELSR
jgi:hypothetical protein